MWHLALGLRDGAWSRGKENVNERDKNGEQIVSGNWKNTDGTAREIGKNVDLCYIAVEQSATLSSVVTHDGKCTYAFGLWQNHFHVEKNQSAYLHVSAKIQKERG